MKSFMLAASPRNWTTEIRITLGLLALTLIAGAFLCAELADILGHLLQAGQGWGAAGQAVFIAAVGSFVYGGIVYQLTRLGFLRRSRAHRRATQAQLAPLRADTLHVPSIAILIPAFKEEDSVVRQALLSAALQDFPNRRVVLLIDDPPQPRDGDSYHCLERMRDLPRELAANLEKPRRKLEDALEDHLWRRRAALDKCQETLLLSALHRDTAHWFEACAAEELQHSHTDRLFTDLVLRAPAREHRARSSELAARAGTGCALDATEILHEFRRLACRFRVALGSFERKRYENLSWEPNKAMNLNAYIGLMDARHREVRERDGLHLERTDDMSGTLAVPRADYIVTLDADSILAHHYTLRLVEWLERPAHRRVAVAQTPYSAVPGATTALERIAGATTDMQYIVHQGFTAHAATFWVGANAVIRTRALQDLRGERQERGHRVPVFIQDRTVIEDTESSIDLIARGWSLHNEPERLAFSATPPDFGALAIQRRRWANGGLVILPKLLRLASLRASGRMGLCEAFLRTHYLTSIALVNASLVLLLVLPFENAMRSWWLPVASVAYFVLYARDLSQAGYRASDAWRAYALNLLLVPVNLSGVGQSLWQMITGTKSSFGRTPKVADRTRVGAGILLSVSALLGLCLWRLGCDVRQGFWFHAVFSLVNGGLLAYALARFVGARAFVEDVAGGIADLVRIGVEIMRDVATRARGLVPLLRER
jgi:cellulose synthase/poly-beta-1,6-N-acetylglucosamine synthase-like glycosyltransferase